MKNKIFFLVLVSLVLSLGFFSKPTFAVDTPSIKSCPTGSQTAGCIDNVIIPNMDLVLEYENTQDITGVELKSFQYTIKLPLKTKKSQETQKYYLISDLTAVSDELSKNKTWDVWVVDRGAADSRAIYVDVPVQATSVTVPLPGAVGNPTNGTGSGTGAAGAGGTAATPGGVTSGGGSVRTGLDQIKKEFQTTGDIAGATSIGSLIVGVIRFLMGILLAVAILMVIIGGFMYVTSAGNEERAKSGRKTIMYALMGVAVVILSYVLVNLVDSAISTGSPF